MNKVQMMVGGRVALVDEDMVARVAKKETLVAELLILEKSIVVCKDAPASRAYLLSLIDKKFAAMRRLNIRPNIQFV